MRLRRVQLVLPLLGVALLVSGEFSNVHACSCVTPLPPCAALTSTELVFVGTVIRSEEQPPREWSPQIRFHFRVDERLKGKAAETVALDTSTSTAACGYPFKVGHQYLVYADGSHVSLCSRTGAIADRQDDLALLHETLDGTVSPRIFGSVARSSQRLNGSSWPAVDRAQGVTIVAEGPDGERQAITDADGYFRFLNLQPGRYRLAPRLAPPLMSVYEREVTVNPGRCSAEAQFAVTVDSLRGTLRESGGAAAGNNVKLTVVPLAMSPGGPAATRSASTYTKADGSWSIEGLPPGRYLLGVNVFDPPSPASPYARRWYPDAEDHVGAGIIEVSDTRTQKVDFMLPKRITPRRVTGLVVDGDGQPIRDASVTIYDDARRRWNVISVRTDAQGRFTVDILEGRRYHAMAGSPWQHKNQLRSELVPVDPSATLRLMLTTSADDDPWH